MYTHYMTRNHIYIYIIYIERYIAMAQNLGPGMDLRKWGPLFPACDGAFCPCHKPGDFGVLLVISPVHE